jgi:two-component system, cell cycle response regulator
VSRWCAQLCTALLCTDSVVDRAELAGRLHEIGKVVVPELTPTPTGPLPAYRELLLSGHPEHGYRLVRTFAGLHDVADVVRQQHARHDGVGSPHGLAGEAIRLEARVVAVCACWATRCGPGGSHEQLPEELALAEMRDGRGSRFDPVVLDAFLDLHDRGRLAPWDRPAPVVVP